jgi:sugar phosphate permease
VRPLGRSCFGGSSGPLTSVWLFGPYAARGVVDLTLAGVASPAVAGGALIVYGMSTATGMVAYQSTLQSLVPVETRGRAFAVYDVLWNGARLVSLAAGGLLAETTDVRFVYVLSAVLLFIAAAVGLTTVLAPSTGAASR